MSNEPLVLLVEDNESLRELMRDALPDFGYRVVTVGDGREALALLESGEQFDFVFSDVSMPNGVSGIELAEHSARLQPDARVILSSGYARAQLPPLPENVTFLPKPYRLPQLLGMLENTQAVAR
ncbi:response regulator [Stenotrophomonas sp. HITSZ_GD]|uniref:response regulator n=1 Tax=Stenotrophomonas sp. HITSZ_GD TaxID=3037248 RepID=UPI00240D5FB3|nr:response regulator [Stenotrophomonas sp. HITSZ_GD]MDG2525046.1 response regulator [Stenotrophomonas sp. HITSZ_GD]